MKNSIDTTNSLFPNYKNTNEVLRRLKNDSESMWAQLGEKKVLRLFHEMAEGVPAYKDFLESKNFSASKVNEIADLRSVPTINKDNYLRKYPKDMLCWGGQFPQGQWDIATTSGSTGNPYYFPRGYLQNWQYAKTAELYLVNNFQIDKKSTLYIIAFPMGAWIGGVFTYEAMQQISQNEQYDVSIITPGLHKKEVISAVKELGSYYDQIIIGSYAPFLKDILDDGEREGIRWQDHQLGFIFSAESLTEKFRDYVIEKTGIKDTITATLNHYGTVDLGTMAHETPESILVRRKLVESDGLQALFPERHKQPTFAQYNPEFFYFEEVNQNLLCSAYSGIPLVRYDLKDYGGVLTKSEVKSQLADNGVDIDKLTASAGITNTVWNLPYVYVYERNDFSVSYYAFLVYPDAIRRSLQGRELQNKITGKFSMAVNFDKTGRQRLHVYIEAKHGVAATEALTAKLQEIVHNILRKENSEYRETFTMVGEDVKPLIHIHAYESPEYFRPGIKQKWVIKK